MSFFPKEPKVGERVSATLIRDIIRCLRRKSLLPGQGYLVRETSHGTHLTIAAGGRGRSAAADKGCWRIVAETVEAEGATCTIHYIDRQFFCVGGMIHEGEDKTTLESLVEAGTPFIAAKITTSGSDYYAAIVGFKNFADMKHASLDRTFSLIPLYELQPQKNAGGEEKKEEEADSVPVVVVTDFRAMPLVQAFELPTKGGVV